MSKCLHCGEEDASRSRGLGPRCYANRTIRAMYPCVSQYGLHGASGMGPEPTDADLDRLIAEQRPTMPEREPEGVRESPYGVIGLRPVCTHPGGRQARHPSKY